MASDGGIFTFGEAGYMGSVPNLPPAGPSRIALYGDSLGMEAGPDFSYIARAAGASTLVRTYGGLAVCDWLPTMTADATSWRPTAVVLEFSGDAFTPCMSGAAIGTQQYYQKYAADVQAAIDIFRPYGTKVFIVGVPYDASAAENQNVTDLDQIYASVAAANAGVTYVDAGQAVMAHGAFTWNLLAFQVSHAQDPRERTLSEPPTESTSAQLGRRPFRDTSPSVTSTRRVRTDSLSPCWLQHSVRDVIQEPETRRPTADRQNADTMLRYEVTCGRLERCCNGSGAKSRPAVLS